MSSRIRVAALMAIALVVSSVPAAEASPAPAWSASALAVPTNFKPGDKKNDFYQVEFTNIGAGPTTGSDIVLSDTLPTGFTVRDVKLKLPSLENGSADFGPVACGTSIAGAITTVTCTVAESIAGADKPALVQPGHRLQMVIDVAVPASASGRVTNVASVEGGGPVPATVESDNEVSNQEAEAGIAEVSSSLTGDEGQAIGQAGSHPFQYTTNFAVNTKLAPPTSTGTFRPAGGDIKDIHVELPPGLVGNPTTVPRCTPQQFSTTRGVVVNGANFFLNECPDETAVGLVSVRQLEGLVGGIGVGAVYNLVPPRGMPAQFGFTVAGAPVFIDTELRSGDYGIDAWVRNTSEAKRISAAGISFWGEPSDPIHNPFRGSCSEIGGLCPPATGTAPFLRLPTSCDSPLRVNASIDTWTLPGTYLSRPSVAPAPFGCELPDFSPKISANPTTTIADSPSGLHVNVHLPQADNEDPNGVGEADLRDAAVTLPPGLLVNPAAADGLASCSIAEVGLLTAVGQQPRFDGEPVTCPDASKLGTVQVNTPLVDHPLPGAVYLARQEQNPFGSLLAIYIVVDDPISGITVKLASKVSPDPATGRLIATLLGGPQTPFEDFELDFFGGDRGSLRTPASCGAYATTAALKPWSAPSSGSDRMPSDSFEINAGPAGPCPSGALAPKLATGLVEPVAGTSSPFLLRLSRADATGQFGAVTATTPPGLTAKLRGVSYCPESAIAALSSRAAPGQGIAEAASPSCPASSRVGTTVAGAGAGPSPFYVSGQVYLAGPYKGAPLSLLAVVPALAGPFDLGVVSVRIALHVDSATAQVTAVSDPLPTILAGIPLDLRDVRVSLDRPGFTLAPTSCEPKSIEVSVMGVAATATLSQRFQVGGCRSLRFAPKLKLKLRGGSKRGDHPALRAALTAKAGEANIARTVLTLPPTELIDNAHIQNPCTRVQFNAGHCPPGSVLGHARAFTPLLDKPLEGPVYFRSNGGEHPLPDIVADLKGQIHIVLVGNVDAIKARIRTTFKTVPDAPVTKFVLSLHGGRKGLLVNSRDICRHRYRAAVRMTAHNGRAEHLRPPLALPCTKR